MLSLRDSFAGVDPILTTLAQGYSLPDNAIANFISPVVPTSTRAGRVLRFGKEAFAVGDYRRSYGSNIPAVQSRFDSEAYALEQEVIAWELPEEVIENCGDGPAQVDLRAIETRNAMQRLMNSYENSVAQAVSTTAAYETGLAYSNYAGYSAAYTANGSDDWAAVGANPIIDVLNLKRAIANQVGIRPNSMVIGTNVYDALLTNAAILDRIKYTTADSINNEILARYFGLDRGIRVGEGRILSSTGTLLPVFPENGILLFYSPQGASDSVLPAGGANAATPAFSYTSTNNIVAFKRVRCVVQ